MVYSTRYKYSAKLRKWPHNCLTSFVVVAVTEWPSVVEDCLVRIESRHCFIYQLLETCTSINFIKHSVLVNFIRKQRQDNCLTWNCTLDFRLNFMDSMLIYLTWISWTPLVTNLIVDRMPKSFQASSLRNNTPIFNNFFMQKSWQKIAGTNSNATIVVL